MVAISHQFCFLSLSNTHTHRTSGIETSENDLTTTSGIIQSIGLNSDGHVKLINVDTDEIFIDIGLIRTLDGFDKRLEKNPNAVLLAFEPNPVNLIRVKKLIPPQIENQILLLPFALSNVTKPQYP